MEDEYDIDACDMPMVECQWDDLYCKALVAEVLMTLRLHTWFEEGSLGWASRVLLMPRSPFHAHGWTSWSDVDVALITMHTIWIVQF